MVPRGVTQANQRNRASGTAMGQDMAEVDFDEFDGGYDMPPAGNGRRRNWVNIAGAVTSVALLIGAGVWGYRIAVRNVMGVPVIHAMEGPMRIAPENPGGEQAEHQGLSVNDVAAVGVATPLPEQIVLAPRAVELTEDDTPGLAAEPPAALAPKPQPEAPVQPLLPQVDAPGVPPGAAPEAVASTLAEPSPAGVSPEAQPSASEQLASDLAAAVPPEPVAPVVEPEVFVPPPVVKGGIGKSLRPMVRPGGMALVPVTAAPFAVREVDPAQLAIGTRLVQFGAFDSIEEAQAHWDKLGATVGDLLAGKGRVIQSAESGGRTFYRLRAEGFSDEADARRFCAAVSAMGPECIPVALR